MGSELSNLLLAYQKAQEDTSSLDRVSSRYWPPWRSLRPLLNRMVSPADPKGTNLSQDHVRASGQPANFSELQHGLPHKPTRFPSPATREPRRSRPRLHELQNPLLSFLSAEHKHKSHANCFEKHLIDAVRLNQRLSELEADQSEAKDRYNSLQADYLDRSAQTTILEEIGGARFNEVTQDHRARMKKDEDGKKISDQKYKACEDKLVTIRMNLDKAMRSVYAIFESGKTAEEGFKSPFLFRFALVRNSGVLSQLHDLEKEFTPLGRQLETSTAQDPDERQILLCRIVEAKKTLQATRFAYRKLENAFLCDHAAPLLGDRASLAQDLTIENLEKLCGTSQSEQEENAPEASEFERRSSRALDGRPLGPDTLPPTSNPELSQLVQDFRATKEEVDDIRKKFEALQKDYAVCYAQWNIVHRGKAPFENVYRTRDTNQKFRDVERGLIARSNVVFPQHDANRARISEYIENVAPPPSDSASTFEAQSSDYNSESEAPTERRHRLANVRPAKVRAWQRGVVKSYRRSLDPNEYRSIHSSSAGVRPAYSLKHYNSFDRDSIERRRARLQKWRERMGFARKDAVLDRDRFLKKEASRTLTSVNVVGA